MKERTPPQEFPWSRSRRLAVVATVLVVAGIVLLGVAWYYVAHACNPTVPACVEPYCHLAPSQGTCYPQALGNYAWGAGWSGILLAGLLGNLAYLEQRRGLAVRRSRSMA